MIYPTFKYFDVIIECPECEREMRRTFSLVEENPDLPIIHKCWCKNQLCQAILEMEYQVKKLGEKNVRLIIYRYLSNEIPAPIQGFVTGELRNDP